MKRYFSLFLLLVLVCALSCTSAFADDDWYVEFTGSEMIQNFNSGTFNEIASAMEPGDNATVTISLRNSSSSATMWYMHNEAINTLEQIRKSAEGGLYSYKLTYTTAAGAANVLYDSTQVGGENADKRDPEGLNQISDKLKDYFYLDNFGSGQHGTVTLYMELEGETQGNGYQNTNAAVEVQFAVEPVTTGSTTRLYSDRPRTADDSALGLYMLCGTGSFLLLMVGMLMKKKTKKISVLLCVLMLLPMLTCVKAAAEDYKYVIKVYSGNVGTIGGRTVKTYERAKGASVDLSEILYGGVALKNEKYYVKGIRLAGRDNVEESLSTLYFDAQEDAEYCVAYGVRGNLTSYTVNYVDAGGRTLAPSQTLYGNVGDKPVVAFRYIDGYQPNAQNMKKTLEADASKNQFTFTYNPIPAPTNTTVTVVTENNVNNNAGGNNNAGAANAANDNAANEQGNAADAQENTGADAAAAGNAEAALQPVDEAAAAAQNGGNTANAPQPGADSAPAAQAPVPTFNPAAVATAAPAELIDLDEVAQNGAFAIGDVAVPLATLQARAENGDRSAKIAIALKYTGYVLLVLIICALITVVVILGNRRYAAKRAYAVTPIRDMSYDTNKKEVYYSPADFNVDDLFDKRS